MPVSAIIPLFFASISILVIGSLISITARSLNSKGLYIYFGSTIFSSAICLYISIVKLVIYPQITLKTNIITSFDFIGIGIYIDNLSAFFILVISLLTLIVSIYSIGYMKGYLARGDMNTFGFMFSIFIMSMLFVATSGHIFFFIIAWEVMAVSSYFLVVYENEKKEVQKAGLVYFVMTHIGTAMITAAFIIIYIYTATPTFYNMDTTLIPSSAKNIIFFLLFIGFGIKAGIIPLHIWLPKAHPAAPSNISALMSGVMIKLSVYAILRFIIMLFPVPESWWGILFIAIGTATMFFGISFALVENNFKKLLAYSSIENMGIIFLAVGIFMTASGKGFIDIAAISLLALLIHTFNHSMFKGLLFLGAGAVHQATGTKDIEKLGGLIRNMPLTSLFFLIACLSISAFPPFNGFIGEWLAYQAIFKSMAFSEAHMKLLMVGTAAVFALSGALVVYTFVKAFGISFLAMPRSACSRKAYESSRPILISMGILALLCLSTGTFPLIPISTVNPVILLVTGFSPVTLSQLTDMNMTIPDITALLSAPLDILGTRISPLFIFLIIMLLCFIPIAIFAIFLPRKNTRVYGTWDCGFDELDSRMQYSATGFSKPARIVFRGFLRPSRELVVKSEGGSFFPRRIRYSVSVGSIIDSHVYKPVTGFVLKFARKARLLIQTGSIHTYLLYIFIAIVLMLIYFILSI